MDIAVNEKENVLAITAEMPGVNKQDIKVNVSDRCVSIMQKEGTRKIILIYLLMSSSRSLV